MTLLGEVNHVMQSFGISISHTDSIDYFNTANFLHLMARQTLGVRLSLAVKSPKLEFINLQM